MGGSGGLCKYKHIFGEERKGIHSWRIFDVAIIDVVATLLVAGVLTYFFNPTWWMFLLILGGLFVAGIVLHRIFCVNTKINTLIFGKI